MFRTWTPLARMLAPVGLTLFLAAVAQAQLPTPQLTGLFPPGGKAGAPVEVTITGDNLDEASKIIFSHPEITSAPKMVESMMPGKPPKPSTTQFTVTVGGNVPAGIYEARVVGRFGVSNPRAFVVGTLEEVLEAGGNNSPDMAAEIKIGSVINGRADANNKDYYKLALKAGERVLLDCLAQRIDSRMDATLAILDSQERELARCRDLQGEDPVLDFTAPAEGTYTIVVYDFVYGGGPEHPYRLLVHQAPRVDFVFPPAAVAGSQGPFTLYGRNLPGSQPAGLTLNGAPLEKLVVNIPVPGDAAALQQAAVGALMLPRSSFVDRFEYRHNTPQGLANPIAIGVATETVVLEQEPNDTPDKAQKVTVPCEIAGQFYPARDFDYVQFDAKKGEVYTIDVLAHRLGLDSDPALVVQRITKNEQGMEVASDVAQVDDPQDRQQRIGSDFDTSTDDPTFRLAVPEDGTYRLLVRDNFGESRSDPRYVYRLIIRKEQPDYRLAVFLDPPSPQNNNNIAILSGPVLRKGGTLELRVNVDRRDSFDGEVQLSVEGLPGGITCPGAIVGGSVESASLVFTAAENVPSWSGPIKVVGKAQVNGQEVVRYARLGACVWGTNNRQQQVPEYRVARDLVLSVMEKETQPAVVQVGEDKIYETARGGKLEIPVKVIRRNGFAENIKLTKANLPNEINVPELNIAGGAADGNLQIQLSQQNIKPGTYTFYLKGETKLKYERNPDAIKEIEAEQAEFAEMQKMLQEELNKANNEKNTTAQAAQQAANERNQAEQNRNNANSAAQQAANNAKTAAENAARAKEAADKEPGNQGLVDAATNAQKQADEAAAAAKSAADKAAEAEKAFVAAQEKLKAAEEAKVKAEQAAQEAQNKVNQANQQKQQLDQRVNQVKQLNQPKDVQFHLVSSPIKMRVADSPVKATIGQNPATVKQGEKLELPVSVERLYGFADGVEVIAELPGGVGGINVPKIDIPKEQGQGMLTFTLNKDATVGEHNVRLRIRTRFNNVQSELEQYVTVRVEAAPAAQ